MKHYIIHFTTNYGLSVMFINATDEKSAVEIAKSHGAWDGYTIQQLDLTTKGIVFHEYS